MDFSHLHQKRVAVVMTIQGGESVVFRGTATYERDEAAGGSIRIEFEDLPAGLGHPSLILHERQWNGRIAVDQQYGCDFCITLASASRTS